MAKAPVRIQFTRTSGLSSPEGTFVFPALDKPRDFQGDENFAYETKLNITDADASELTEVLERAQAAAVEEAKTQLSAHSGKTVKSVKLFPLPIAPAVDKEGEELPGLVTVKFKVKAYQKTKNGIWDRKPLLLQGSKVGGEVIGNPLPKGTCPRGGSVGRIAFDIDPWYTAALGLGLRLVPVACLFSELVTPGESGEGQKRAATSAFGIKLGAALPGESSADEDDSQCDEPSEDTPNSDF